MRDSTSREYVDISSETMDPLSGKMAGMVVVVGGVCVFLEQRALTGRSRSRFRFIFNLKMWGKPVVYILCPIFAVCISHREPSNPKGYLVGVKVQAMGVLAVLQRGMW